MLKETRKMDLRQFKFKQTALDSVRCWPHGGPGRGENNLPWILTLSHGTAAVEFYLLFLDFTWNEDDLALPDTDPGQEPEHWQRGTRGGTLDAEGGTGKGVQKPHRSPLPEFPNYNLSGGAWARAFKKGYTGGSDVEQDEDHCIGHVEPRRLWRIISRSSFHGHPNPSPDTQQW